jgi:hypothetical protein
VSLRLPAYLLCASAAAGLATAPAIAASADGSLIAICTSHGRKWIKLPPRPEEGDRRAEQGCAHMLCPRGFGPRRDKRPRLPS